MSIENKKSNQQHSKTQDKNFDYIFATVLTTIAGSKIWGFYDAYQHDRLSNYYETLKSFCNTCKVSRGEDIRIINYDGNYMDLYNLRQHMKDVGGSINSYTVFEGKLCPIVSLTQKAFDNIISFPVAKNIAYSHAVATIISSALASVAWMSGDKFIIDSVSSVVNKSTSAVYQILGIESSSLCAGDNGIFDQNQEL